MAVTKIGSVYRDRKPPPGLPINRNHPLAQGLVAASILAGPGGWPTDSLTGEIAVTAPGTNASGNAPQVLTGERGLVRRIDSTLNNWQFADRPQLSSSYLSVAMRLRFLTNTGANIQWADKWASTVSGYYLYTGAAAFPDLAFITVTTNGQVSLSGTGALTLNHWYDVVWTYDGANMRIYLDGVQSISAVQTGTLVANAQAVKTYYAGVTGLLADLEYTYIWSRALSEGEIRLLAREPYAMFSARAPRVFFDVAAALSAAQEIGIFDAQQSGHFTGLMYQ